MVHHIGVRNWRMLIFGFGPGKAQDLGEVAPVTCAGCRNDVFLHRMRTRKAVRLYFVPVVPLGTDEYLLCPICSRGVQLEREQMPVVEQLQALTAAMRTGRITDDEYRDEVTVGLTELGIVATPQRAELEAQLEHLEQLERLHHEGVLSDEEFNAARRRVLGAH
jgi:hypothetical protein